MGLTINPSTFAITSSGKINGTIVITSNTTDGESTLSAASIVGGVINRSGSTDVFSDTMPTATQILAAMPSATIGTAFSVRIINASLYTQTILTATGITMSGAMSISAGAYCDFIGIFTAITSPAITFSNIGGGFNAPSNTGLVKIAYTTADFNVAQSAVELTFSEGLDGSNTMPFLVKQKMAFSDTYTPQAGLAATLTYSGTDTGAFTNNPFNNLVTINDYFLTNIAQTALGLGSSGIMSARADSTYVLNSGAISSTQYRLTIEIWGVRI